MTLKADEFLIQGLFQSIKTMLLALYQKCQCQPDVSNGGTKHVVHLDTVYDSIFHC